MPPSTPPIVEPSDAPRRARSAAAACGGLLLAVLAVARPAAGTVLPERFIDQTVVSGLNDPTGFTFLPDGRIVLVERSGPIRLIAEGKLGAVDPLTVVDSVDTSGDGGLTGVAIDPRWPTYPYVYVYYDALDGFCKITRFTAAGDLDASSSLYLTLDPASRYDVMADIPDLLDLHNGGTIRFGADSMMYAALGEDGSACAAQDTTSLRGVVIRIDVRGLPDGPGGPPDKNLLVPPDNPFAGHAVANARLVWATGLRNPFRFHFDPATGAMFLGDVGFNLFEEVDLVEGPVPNFGWPYFEGPAAFAGSCPGILNGGPLTPPIHAYDRTGLQPASIIGAGVYRLGPCASCSFPSEYDGDYFFADFYQGFLRRLKNVGGQWLIAPPAAGQPNSQDWGAGFQEVADYEQSGDGSLWYCRMSVEFTPGTGEMHRVYFDAPAAGTDGAHAAALEFSPPFPSPARGPVQLAFALPRPAEIALELFDAQGREVRTLIDGVRLGPGRHRLTWDGFDRDGHAAAPGIYHARLRVAGATALTRRLILVR